jgi:glycosyltransferase involved in cell wall biosynthesis
VKRLLFITGGIHYPTNSGFSVRVYNLLKIYANVFDVVLIANSFDARDENEIRQHLISLTLDFRFVPEGKFRMPNVIKKYIYPTKPIAVTDMKSRALRNTITEMRAAYEPFDFIHIERLVMTEMVKHDLVRRSSNSKFILDLDDWESKMRFREHKVNPERNLIRRIKRSIEPRRLRAYEKRFLPLYDWVYVCSEQDRQEISHEFGLNNVVVVPNGYTVPRAIDCNLTYFQPEKNIILCIGVLSYGPNSNGVKYFVDNIFPLVLNNVPDAQLWIAGPGAPPWIQRLNEHPSIRVLGFCEDLNELYARAAVVIVPILSGGGTRVKILEAASFGKAIVSTSIGSEGLDFTHGKNIWIADEPAAFSEACCLLLEDGRKRRVIGKHARKLVETKYQWHQIAERLMQTLLDRA